MPYYGTGVNDVEKFAFNRPPTVVPSFGEYAGAVWEDALMDNPTVRAFRAYDLYQANNIPEAEKLSPADANEKYGIPGELDFGEPIADSAAAILHENYRRRRKTATIGALRGDSTWDAIGAFGVGLGAGMLDPAMAAASLIPVTAGSGALVQRAALGRALGVTASRSAIDREIAKMPAKFFISGQAQREMIARGLDAASKAGVAELAAAKVVESSFRAKVAAGVVEGAVGNAAFEPTIAALGAYLQDPVGVQESMINIVGGGAFGGGLAAAGAAWHRAFRTHQVALPEALRAVASGEPVDAPVGLSEQIRLQGVVDELNAAIDAKAKIAARSPDAGSSTTPEPVFREVDELDEGPRVKTDWAAETAKMFGEPVDAPSVDAPSVDAPSVDAPPVDAWIEAADNAVPATVTPEPVVESPNIAAVERELAHPAGRAMEVPTAKTASEEMLAREEPPPRQGRVLDHRRSDGGTPPPVDESITDQLKLENAGVVETPAPVSNVDKVQQAFFAARAKKVSYRAPSSTISIHELVQETGLSQAEVHAAVLDAVEKGDAKLRTTDYPNATDEVRAAGIAYKGETFLRVHFKTPEAPQLSAAGYAFTPSKWWMETYRDYPRALTTELRAYRKDPGGYEKRLRQTGIAMVEDTSGYAVAPQPGQAQGQGVFSSVALGDAPGVSKSASLLRRPQEAKGQRILRPADAMAAAQLMLWTKETADDAPVLVNGKLENIEFNESIVHTSLTALAYADIVPLVDRVAQMPLDPNLTFGDQLPVYLRELKRARVNLQRDIDARHREIAEATTSVGRQESDAHWDYVPDVFRRNDPEAATRPFDAQEVHLDSLKFNEEFMQKFEGRYMEPLPYHEAMAPILAVPGLRPMADWLAGVFAKDPTLRPPTVTVAAPNVGVGAKYAMGAYNLEAHPALPWTSNTVVVHPLAPNMAFILLHEMLHAVHAQRAKQVVETGEYPHLVSDVLAEIAEKTGGFPSLQYDPPREIVPRLTQGEMVFGPQPPHIQLQALQAMLGFIEHGDKVFRDPVYMTSLRELAAVADVKLPPLPTDVDTTGAVTHATPHSVAGWLMTAKGAEESAKVISKLPSSLQTQLETALKYLQQAQEQKPAAAPDAPRFEGGLASAVLLKYGFTSPGTVDPVIRVSPFTVAADSPAPAWRADVLERWETPPATPEGVVETGPLPTWRQIDRLETAVTNTFNCLLT